MRILTSRFHWSLSPPSFLLDWAVSAPAAPSPRAPPAAPFPSLTLEVGVSVRQMLL